MRKSLIVLIVAVITAIAALASVSFGLSHALAVMETVSFPGMANNHMNRRNSAACDYNVTSHMNETEHMGENICSEHEDMHNQLNMTENMQSMRENGDITWSHMGNNHRGCHD